MIQPFHSESSTVEKASSFWNAFERATEGLSDALRLSAFREFLKGKPGEEWWMYSQIDDFETLRTRFHNQFICLTTLQMIERLKTSKRSKGVSAEVWGDLISNLCDAAQCYDPQMRYQYFLSGLRNKEWRAVLMTTMVNTIPQAVAVLLYKGMHIPIEDDSEFASDSPAKPASENSMMQQMLTMMQQTQSLLVQQQQQHLAQSPRSPRRSMVSAAYDTPPSPRNNGSSPAGNASMPPTPFRGIRQGPDMYTQEGRTVCGRCHLLGCSRISCRRSNAVCTNCQAKGHIAVECDRDPSSAAAGAQGGLPRGVRECYVCGITEHLMRQCPDRATLRRSYSKGASGGAPAQGTAPIQQ